MHTRRSPPQSQSEGPPNEGPKKCHWSLDDESRFIDYLVEHRSEAGDNAQFKATTWNSAAAYMAKFHKQQDGAVKTGKACSSKWARLKDAYMVVAVLKSLSGFNWHDTHGLNITTESSDAFKVYCLTHPKATPYRNRGFPHFEAMTPIMPVKLRNQNPYRPKIQTFGAAAHTPAPSAAASTSAGKGKDVIRDTNIISLNDSDSDNAMTANPPTLPPSSRPPSPPSSSSSPHSPPPRHPLLNHPHSSLPPPSMPPTQSPITPVSPTVRISTGASSARSSVQTSSSKRKYSALGEDDSVASGSGASASKRARGNGAALNGIKEALDGVGESLRSYVDDRVKRTRRQEQRLLPVQSAPPVQSARPPSPERRLAAVDHLQAEHKHLPDEHVVALVDLITTSTSTADTYMALQTRAYRDIWVRRRLAALNYVEAEAADV